MKKEEIKITYLPFPKNVQSRPGMFLGSVQNADQLLLETIENAEDESTAGYAKRILISNNYCGTGYKFVADDGRGIPISMSAQYHNITQTELVMTTLNSGSKFEKTGGKVSQGMHGVGLAASSAISEVMYVLSRITEDNYNTSIPAVREVWDRVKIGKGELYYLFETKKGYKTLETAGVS